MCDNNNYRYEIRKKRTQDKRRTTFKCDKTKKFKTKIKETRKIKRNCEMENNLNHELSKNPWIHLHQLLVLSETDKEE